MFSISGRLNRTKRLMGIGVLLGTVLVASIGLLMNVHSAKAAQICNTSGMISMGKYWLNSNEWGASSGSGTQCIWDTSNTGSSIAWGTSWNWTGQSNSVKTYDSSVLGWHWGWQNTNTGLPIQLSSNKGVQTGWNFNLTQNNANTLDVSYDLWLHTISNPTSSSGPSDEVMVWLYKAGGAGPVGTKQATVTLGGTSWDLYEGNIGWEVHSFVRTTNTTSQTLDLKDFLNYLVSRGLSSSKYLSSVESGTEIFTGNGRLDTTSYYANVVTEGSGGGSTPTPAPGTTPTPRPTSTPTPGNGGGFNPNPNSHYRIVNRNSGQVLDVSGASTANGGLIDQWPSNGGNNQLWRFVATNGGYKLVNVNSGLLLDDPGASKINGTQLDQWNDTNGSNQWWNVVSAGSGYYSLVNQSSGEDADVSGASTANGAAVLQWPSTGGTNQQWSLVQVS
ncbi:MAG: RICIN domain-containing protein [Ktedonobacteraceae bacterium]|nr:RICIN domain-containing protein [Ktedonobacteraceae bacterium]